MASYSAFSSFDFELPTPPAVPNWLGSLCSQIDSYKDVTLPQVFTPRDHNSDTHIPFKAKGYDFNDQHLFQINEEHKTDDRSGMTPFLHTQCEPERLSRSLPSLQSLLGRNDDSDIDFNEDTHFPGPSQPWPSCDTMKLASQVSQAERGDILGASSNSLQVSDYSPTFPTFVSPASSHFNSIPFSSSVNQPSPVQGLRKSNTKFIMPTQKFGITTRKAQDQMPDKQSNRSTADMSITNTVQTCVPPSCATVSAGRVVQSPAVHVQTERNEHISRTGNGSNTDFSSILSTCNDSATSDMGRHCHPFTPAQINFQGACGSEVKLHSVDEIPKPFRDIFPFPFFNAVQSVAFDKLLYTDSSVVVSAPTGSGKTTLFELAMVRLLLCTQVPLRDIKVVYIGPMKSLCGERVDDWRQKFLPLGLQCMELTGDTDLSDFSSLHHVQLICTTPEKWDSVTRRWKDNRQLFQSIHLVCIDEVHVVGDSQRGATVEAVITRMKMVQTICTTTSAHSFRFVAVSATLPNIEDIAMWLSSETSPAVVFKLGEEYRPVRLQRVVLGYPFSEGSSEFRFDLNLTYKLHSIIDNYCNGKPTLVFCSSRKSCQQTAETLIKSRWGKGSFLLPQFRQDINIAANRVQERKLSDLLMSGIGIHHAGLAAQDRKLVEDLFRTGKLAVLIATSTLSVGVNLPAHLVVVKATHIYVMGVAREYSDQQVLQMIGRAGRPQFDTSATVVIMTKMQLKAKYEALVNGTQIIESMLHKNLIEHVNVEIVLNTITDMADAASWLSHTLLHVRATKNPVHYGLPAGLDAKQVELKLQDLCMAAINQLNSHQLVSVDPETAMTSPTERGRLMARYCIEFKTIKCLSGMSLKSTMEDLVGVIASCPEFQDIQLRTSEKRMLNSLNKNKHQETVRYPLKGKIKTKQMKVNCLIQAGLGCLPIQDYSLSQDLLKIFRVGQRVTKCLMELQWLGEDYTTLLNAIMLCKAFKAKLWPDSIHVARQLEGIGPSISQALIQAGLTSFQLLEASDPHHLELVVNRHPPFGSRIRDAVNHLPRYELVIQQEKKHQAASAELVVGVSMLNAEDVKSSSTCGSDHPLIFIIGDEDNSIVFKWRLWDRMLLSQAWRRKLQVKRALAGSSLHVGLISLEWVGLDIHTVYQPFYTASCHPQQHLKDMQSSGPRAKQTNKGTPAAKGNQGQQNSQQHSMAKGQKADNKIQQQLDVMQYKLQQFQYTKPKTMQKLTQNDDGHQTRQIQFKDGNQRALLKQSTWNSGMHADTVFPGDAAAGHGNSTPDSLNKDIQTRDTGPASIKNCNLPVTPCKEDEAGLSCHVIEFLTVPWGDLVDDFWEEDDFLEPPNKTAKTADCSSYKGFESVLSSPVYPGTSFVPPNSNVCSPDDTKCGSSQTALPTSKSSLTNCSHQGGGQKAGDTKHAGSSPISQSVVEGVYSSTDANLNQVDCQKSWQESINQDAYNTSVLVPNDDGSCFNKHSTVYMQSSDSHITHTSTDHIISIPDRSLDFKIDSRTKPESASANTDNSKAAAYKQCASKTTPKKGTDENVSRPSAFGWEQLQLYQSLRESLAYQETQTSLDGEEENQCLSQQPQWLSYQQQEQVTGTSPAMARVMQTPVDFKKNRETTTGNLLDGIF